MHGRGLNDKHHKANREGVVSCYHVVEGGVEVGGWRWWREWREWRLHVRLFQL